MKMRFIGLVLAATVLGAGARAQSAQTDVTIPPSVCGYEVIKEYPHDRNAFTQGLIFHDGALYESTGHYGRSHVARLDIASGKAVKQTAFGPNEFGEGITRWKNQIIGVTWQNGVGHRWRVKDLKPTASFRYEGEGWGLTATERHIVLSDGTSLLRFLDPATMKVVKTITVTNQGEPLTQLNELEYINGEIWANIWFSDMIARIDPQSGNVKHFVDLSGLKARADARGYDDVLNGIAWDEKGKRLFVTGKNWPKLFEIKLTACQI